MFCRYCGKKIDETSNFCPYCGRKLKEILTLKEKESQESEIKTYSSEFWKYFWIGIALSIFAGVLEASHSDFLAILYLIALVIYIYSFCKMVNEAMLSIGKKNWWPLGLLSLIPFGFWIVFFVVRAQLKPHGRWSLKRETPIWVIVIIILIFVAFIAIVFISLSGARQRAKDARTMADLAQARAIAELIYDEYGSYEPLCDMNNTLNQNIPVYGLQLAEIENNIKISQGETPYFVCYSSNDKYCIETKISSGFYCIDSEGNAVRNIVQECTPYNIRCAP